MTANCDFFSFYHYFFCFAFLKVKPSEHLNILLSINDIFDKIRITGDDVIVDYIEPVFSFGQYDIMFGFSTSEVAEGSRFFYALIDTLNQKYPGAIQDFFKTVNFEWKSKESPNPDFFRLAYATIKYKNPHERERYDRLAAITIMEDIYNICIKYDLNLSFKLYGSFAWNEVTILFFGDNYDAIEKLTKAFTTLTIAAETRFTIIWDFLHNQDLLLPENCVVNTQLAISSDFNISNLYNLFESFLPSGAKVFNALNYIIVSFKPSHPNKFSSFMQEITRMKHLRYTNTNIFFEDKNEVELSSNEFIKIDDFIPIDVQEVKNRLLYIGSQSMHRRKLLALHTELDLLQKLPNYRNMLPENICDAINFLLNDVEDLSDESAQFFISEFIAAARERLAGSQLDALVGKDIGFLEDHGSYQRLILSCESLVLSCCQLYLRNIRQDTKFSVWPLLFTFFNYGARLSPDIPTEIVSKGLTDNLPIVLRLKMVKYKPWLWVTGLREVSKLLYFVTRGVPMTEVMAEDPDVIGFGDKFLRNFFSHENVSRIIKEELNFFTRTSKNEFRIDPRVEEEVVNRMVLLESDSEYISDRLIDNKLIKNIQNQLMRGEFIFRMDDCTFINFINAYQSLPRMSQLYAASFISYTISLYWRYWQLLEEKNAIHKN